MARRRLTNRWFLKKHATAYPRDVHPLETVIYFELVHCFHSMNPVHDLTVNRLVANSIMDIIYSPVIQLKYFLTGHHIQFR